MANLTQQVADQLIAAQGKEIVIPNVFTTIDFAAFSSEHLTSVIIPSSVTYIDTTAFFNNKFSSIVIPNSVTYIGARSFSGMNYPVLRLAIILAKFLMVLLSTMH